MTSKGSSREGRGESSRSSHSNHHGKGQSRANAAVAEPLFPRVHVSDTRNGPKAPPRNKMALYEQLTVPSQHFLQRQTSGLVWPPMNPAYASQYAPFASNCFTPCFAPPGLSFHHHASSTDGGTASQSMGAPLGSQKSMVMDSEVDKELQRVPRVVDENNPVGGGGNAATPTTPCAARPVPCAKSSSQQQQQQHPSANTITAATANVVNTTMANATLANVNKRVRNEDDFAVPTYCFPKDGKGVEAGSGSKQQQQQHSNTRSEMNASKSSAAEIVERTVPSSAGVSSSPAAVAGVTAPAAGRGGGGGAAATAAPGVISPHKGHTEHISSSNICESAAGSDNQSDDFFQSLHEEQVSGDGDSNASIVDPFGKIAARDVVGAVGEKEFWKTRKTILRQQRIFETQVFELHRVVKVQHLLAESPKLLLEPDHARFHLAQPLPITHEIATPAEGRQLAHPPVAVRGSNKDQTTNFTTAQASKPLYNPKDQHRQQRSYSTAPADISPREAPPPPPAVTATLINTCSSSPAPPPPPPPPEMNSSSTTTTQGMTYQTFPGAANSWGYATFPAGNQWAMLPPSCQPYVFQPPPNAAQMLPGYGAAYQPVFHNGAGSYELFPMVPRPPRMQTAEMQPVYWQQPMYPSVHSSGWYAFPPQFFDSSSVQTPQPSKLPKSANSTVMSPMDLQQEQRQQQQQYQQQQQQQQPKFPGSTHNSDMSSIAQSSDYHHFQQQEQQEKRGPEMTQRWIEGERQQHGVSYSLPFSYVPPSERHEQQQQQGGGGGAGFNGNNGAMKVVPRAVMATPESAAGILKSIQRERR
ncbi:protein EARLY FLOWERING 3 isoform X1 [Selaginella moellendorffii]|uniref:protein EARLY FLOWERING 3 isoform X1 n=2 Tax=Selaginella moellendorffii TaxID=88036 RepID=UPI000D1CF951|nr:protein EARLY FLOWERING 3 isoform X1 [Selaginella moellendorffii]|eukprot:XP_024531058.1 protein EARLY FLOWERING 3 isoform X1 [Selaginella moellendorffii]